MIKIEIYSTNLSPKSMCDCIDFLKERQPDAEIVFKADINCVLEEVN